MLEAKYQSLLHEASQRGWADAESLALCFSLLSLAARIDRDCAARLAPAGLSEGRFVLLFLLACADEPLAPHALASRAGIRRATVTGLLDGLEREALIERLADPLDRRALRIQLTPQGQRLADSLLAQHSQWIASLFAALEPTERKQLAALLHKAAANLPPPITPREAQ